MEDRRREEVEGEGSWNRAGDWLRPALSAVHCSVNVTILHISFDYQQAAISK